MRKIKGKKEIDQIYKEKCKDKSQIDFHLRIQQSSRTLPKDFTTQRKKTEKDKSDLRKGDSCV